jgi:uncharacterized protein YgiM (DUF1202 family)
MKMKFWTILAAMISTSVLADQATVPAATSAATPAVEKPAEAPKAAAKKPAVKAPKRSVASEVRSVPLVPGSAIVAANRVNVRGQGKLKSEVIGRMTNGEPVTVIEEIHLKNSGPDEPSAWAKIVLPEKIHPWVHSSYIDPTSKTVVPKTLNIRGGPGENYSILGTLQKGDVIKEIQVKDKWIQIEAPASAYAFMAAQYLTQDPTMMAVANPTAITEPPVVAPLTSELPNDITTATNDAALAMTNEVATTMTEVPAVDEPPAPRIVQREGVVRNTVSIQAPSLFQLVSTDNGRVINYLYTASPYLDLNRYKGLHIIVTGEEGLDERWKNTPVITIHKIQVLE